MNNNYVTIRNGVKVKLLTNLPIGLVETAELLNVFEQANCNIDQGAIKLHSFHIHTLTLPMHLTPMQPCTHFLKYVIHQNTFLVKKERIIACIFCHPKPETPNDP